MVNKSKLQIITFDIFLLHGIMSVQFLPVSFGFQFKGLNIVLTQKIFLVVKIKLSVQFRLPYKLCFQFLFF